MKKVHFIGIGGIGMSGLAVLAQHQGYQVSGCDKNCTSGRVFDLLIKQSIHPLQGHDKNHIKNDIDILVYSSALSFDHPEMKQAKNNNIKIIHRAEFLQQLTQDFAFRIGISGAHGKTTTTAMVGAMFASAKIDPTVYVGGICQNFGSNVRLGNSDYCIMEADESDGSFLNLSLTTSVITNIDNEHLETYGDFEGVKKAFQTFADQSEQAVVCSDDPFVRELKVKNSTSYGLNQKYDPVICATEIVYGPDKTDFTLLISGNPAGPATINMPGKHNLLNALAAVGVGFLHNLSAPQMIKGLATFSGVVRRFEYKGSFRGAEIFDDYAHHPVEISVAIKAAKKRTKGRLIVLFQPHKYSRTKDLWTEFVDVLSQGQQDKLYLLDIYAAGQKPYENVSSQKLVAEIKAQGCLDTEHLSAEAAVQKVANELEEGDLLLTVGAGNVYKIGELLR